MKNGVLKAANKKLLDSAFLGDAEGLKTALAAGADADAKDREGWTAAMLAASNESEDGMRWLIAAGADLDAKGIDGWTAAMIAARYGRGACLCLLAAAGVDLEAKDSDGKTAAMIAASYGHPGAAGLIDSLSLSRREAAEMERASGDGAAGGGGRPLRV